MATPLQRTARDLVTKSLKRIGVIAGSETPSADLLVDGLDRLIGVLETWSTESLVVYAQQTLSPPQPLVARSVYTIGPGGDIDVPIRPPWLDLVTLVYPAPYEVRLTPLSRAAWDRETQKALSAGYASAAFYNPTWPLGRLHLWPVYDGGGGVVTLGLYLPVPLNTRPDLDTVLDLPPGYDRALRDTLAVELVPEFPGRALDPLLLKIATDAKAQLERTNFTPRTLGLPAGLPGGCGGHYNWLTDEVQ